MKKDTQPMFLTNARQKGKNMNYKENLKILNCHSLKWNLKRQQKLG